MMRHRSVLPMVGFCLLVLGGMGFWDPFRSSYLVVLGLLIGYVWTYLSAMQEVRRNSYAVLRLGEPKPWLIPLSMFLLGTAVIWAFVLPRSMASLLVALGTLIPAVGFYLLGVWILIRDLRAESQRRIPSATPGGNAKKLLLVNPVNPAKVGLTMNASSTFPPLGLGILAALTPREYEVVLADENMEPFGYQDADLVGITAFTASAPRAYEIAAMYRERHIPVIMGGFTPPCVPRKPSSTVTAWSSARLKASGGR